MDDVKLKKKGTVLSRSNTEDEPLSVADLGGAQGTRDPLGTQILSISCSFLENLAKLYVGAPPGELAPPWENPGSAAGSYQYEMLLS